MMNHQPATIYYSSYSSSGSSLGTSLNRGGEMMGHSTIDNKYITYGMLDNISFCGCRIHTPQFLEGGVAPSVLH